MVLVFIVYIGAYAIYALGGWGSETARLVFGHLASLPLGLLAVLFAWRTSRHPALEKPVRRAWSLLSMAFLATLLGDALWFVFDAILNESPYPSPADIPYLAYYPLVFIAALMFPAATRSPQQRIRFALDAGTTIAAGGMLVAYLVVYPLASRVHPGFLGTLLSIVYPCLDLLLLWAAVTLSLGRHSPALTKALRILAAAFVVDFCADMLFSFQFLAGAYRPARLADALFLLGVGLRAYAALVQYREAGNTSSYSPEAEAPGRDRVAVLPYLSVAAGFGVALYALRDRIGEEAGQIVVVSGVLTAVVVVRQIVSIRERIGAERALRQSQDLLEKVISATPVAVLATDLEENVTLWSDAAERIFGWSAEEVVGKPWPAVPSGKEAESDEIRRRCINGEELGVVSIVRRRKDGQLIDIESRFAPLVTASGEVIGSVSVMEDVTEKKLMEKRLGVLIQAAPLAIIQVDREERVQLWNRTAEQILGWTEEEVLGKPLPFVSEEMREDSERHRRSSLAGETHNGLEITRRRKDGQLIDLSLSSAPVHDRDGNVTGIIGLLRDITQEKQVREQLRQSQKMEAIGQLAGGIAHDFNNLLTAIIGNVDMLLNGDSEPTVMRQDVAEIKGAAERAGSLTRQILAFSRRQTLKPQVVSLNHIVNDAAPLLTRTLGEDVEMEFLLDPAAQLVEVDPHQLQQVLLNLTLNARDAMGPGGTLTIETANVASTSSQAQSADGVGTENWVMLAVSDEGCGIDEESLSRVFEPFFTTKPLGQGTGLGLATVHGIVMQSGGTIRVESEVGKGTTFRVYLPAKQAAASTNQPDAPGRDKRHDGAETILVVEDEPAVLFLVSRVLVGRGYRVFTASNGAEVDRVLETADTEIDLLLTDVMLPGSRQGSGVADAVRKSRGDIPVLFMSGYPQNEIGDAGRLFEGIDFIEKPFTPDVLAKRVRDILDGR